MLTGYFPLRPVASSGLSVDCDQDVGEAGPVLCAMEGQVDNLAELGAPLGLNAPQTGPATMLAAAWRRWGLATLARLRGSFVIAAWDREQRRGAVAVDQLGTRSVYYRTHGGGVTFASEISDLLNLLDRRPGPDPAYLVHWLSFTDPPPAATPHEGVHRLAGGQLLSLRERTYDVASYWPTGSATPARAAVEEVRVRVQQSVARVLPDEVTRGAVLLSGGLDSTTVAALAAARAAPATVSTYSATFPGAPSADESELIAQLADRWNLTTTALAVRAGSAVAGSLEYLEQAQLPPTSPNLFFWMPLMRRAAQDGVRVMLDGEGGDELFGAVRYLPADALRRGRLVEAYRLVTRMPGVTEASRRRLLRVLADYGVRGALPGPLRRLAATVGWGREDTPFWLAPAARKVHRSTLDPDRWMNPGGPRWRAWLLHVLRDSTGGPQLAREHVRRRSQLAGLTPRHPMLDVDTVELMLALDPELSLDPVLDRPLLRQAMADMLPDAIRLRPRKSSFDAPFHQSLLRELPAIAALLAGPRSQLGEYVDLATLRREVIERPGRSFSLGGHAWSLAIWRLVTAELWLRLQVDPQEPRLALERAGFPAATLDAALERPAACR
jgi:asparagine synthase (glutamine-hydrolysing)